MVIEIHCVHMQTKHFFISYCFGPINNKALMNRFIFRNLLCSAVAFTYIFFSHPKKLSWPNFLIRGPPLSPNAAAAQQSRYDVQTASLSARSVHSGLLKICKWVRGNSKKILPTSSRGQTTVAGQRRRGK